MDMTELLEWRDFDSVSEITYAGYGPYMVERLSDHEYRAWFPDEAGLARIMVVGFHSREEARAACQGAVDGRRALALVTECAPYLERGETPLQRIERDFKDTDGLLSALAAARSEP